MEIDKAFPESLDLMLPGGKVVELKIEYSWKPMKCSICKHYGHSGENCNMGKGLKKETERQRRTSKTWVEDSRRVEGNQKKGNMERIVLARGRSRMRRAPIEESNNRFEVIVVEETENGEGDSSTLSLKGKESLLEGGHVKELEIPTRKEIGSTSGKEKEEGSGRVESQVETHNSEVEREELKEDGTLSRGMESPEIRPFGKGIKVDEKDLKGNVNGRVNKTQKRKPKKGRETLSISSHD